MRWLFSLRVGIGVIPFLLVLVGAEGCVKTD
jgi:hypothetical protein